MTRARVVVLVSGTGTNLQALIDAAVDPGYPAVVVGVGADRAGTQALLRAEAARIDTFVLAVPDFPDRDAWDVAMAAAVSGFAPDLVVSAGFMKLAGPAFLKAFRGRYLNTHPALLPSFPGPHAVRDTLAYGVKVTGCTIFAVDEGVDTGPIIAQSAVPVLAGDDEATLHERIKSVERSLLVDTVADLARGELRIDGRRADLP